MKTESVDATIRNKGRRANLRVMKEAVTQLRSRRLESRSGMAGQ